MKPLPLSLSIGLFTLAAGIAQTPPTLDQALAGIRRNVETFEKQLPDFVCKEKITSRTVAEEDQRVIKETVIESMFTGHQKHAPLTQTTFAEERQSITVDGAPSPGRSMPRGVFLVGGGYSSSLISVFGSKGEANYSFSIEAPFVISFASKTGKQKIIETHGAHSFRETGRAWFDPASLEVTRLERRIAPKGSEPGQELTITIEYQPVRIGDEQFQMPARVVATAHRVASGKAERGDYQAEYTGYRKYGASTTIRFQDLEKP